MAFSKLKTGPATVAKPTPAPVVKAAEVVKDIEVVAEVVTTNTPTAAPVANTLALFGQTFAGMGNALSVLTDLEDFKPSTFPVLTLTGGKTGGLFSPASYVAEEVANQLPQGKKPINAIFMGFRTEVVSWAEGYKEGQTETAKPLFTVAISGMNAELTKQAAAAAKAYQYTKGDQKSAKYDFATTQVGHLGVSLALLVYLPEVDDVIEIKTPSKYASWLNTMENLKRQATDGQLGQFPCVLRPVSVSKVVNGWDINEHSIDFVKKIDAESKGWYEAYTAYIAKAAADPEMRENLESWVNGTDRPMTAMSRTSLSTAPTK